MSAHRKLIAIKLIHTLIWVFFNAVLAYLFYAVLTGNIDQWFWIGIGVIVLECIILISLKWTCPLTIVARRYSNSEKENFDIYLPLWLAKYNKEIYSTLFFILVILYISLIL